MSILRLTPFVPSDSALKNSFLPDKALELHKQSSLLMGQLSPLTLSTLEKYMRVINSYYSNLIEGNATHPREVLAAQRGAYSEDAAKRDLQQESLGHMAVQRWLAKRSLDLGTIFTADFICDLHRRFYQEIPESLCLIKDKTGNIIDKLVPGEWRKRAVDVGMHLAPDAKDIDILMSSFCEKYHPQNYQGDRKLIAIMAAHHRFAWIHPFINGNGRVGRLLTDSALKAIGLDSYGAWCLSRGLARSSQIYKSQLAQADQPRQGDLDGRGSLSEKGLLSFCEFMLDTALDQVTYMSDLLDLGRFRKRMNSYVEARNDFRVRGMDESLKKQAALVLHTAFIQGEIERRDALDLCGMSIRSARRLLSQLKAEGLLSETSSKSPLRWEIPEHAEPWYFPDLIPLA